MAQSLRVEHPSFAGRIGVARRDITPPVGIYSRMWGSALHDVAEGIHRPLSTTAMTFQKASGGDPLVLVAIDGGWWRTEEDFEFVRGPVVEELRLDPNRLMLHLSHTHAGPSISLTTADKPGGDKVRPYMERLRRAVIEAVQQALTTAQPATLAWHTGRCDLAANRVLPAPDGAEMVVGFNPANSADDTLLVGRVTDATGRVMGTLVNYACHPTTLGGANRLISPDYIGAMREVVEGETRGAPCLFMLGACGELAPRRQYEGDAAVADQNGRQLGHAAVSTLYSMQPPGKALAFDRVEESGARLGRWEPADDNPDTLLDAAHETVELPLKAMPTRDELLRRIAAKPDRITAEKLERALMLRTRVGGSKTLGVPVYVWRLGGAVLIATPCEAGSALQIDLRRKFPQHAIAVMNIVNGYQSYLPPREEYESAGTYQTAVSFFEPGGLEKVIEAAAELSESTSPDRQIARSPNL